MENQQSLLNTESRGSTPTKDTLGQSQHCPQSDPSAKDEEEKILNNPKLDHNPSAKDEEEKIPNNPKLDHNHTSTR